MYKEKILPASANPTNVSYFGGENNTRALHNIESIGKLLLLEGIQTVLNSTKESLCLQHESALPALFALHCTVGGGCALLVSGALLRFGFVALEFSQ